MAEKRDFRDAKDTLVAVDGEASGQEARENQAKMTGMLDWVRAGDQDVIQINKDEIQTTEDIIHQALECLSGVL